MTIEKQIVDIATAARNAAKIMAAVPRRQKDTALTAMAGLLKKNTGALREENAKDVAAARENGLEF